MDDIAQEILNVDLKDELKKSYLDYAMSVIVGRALPDLRDGLKPVHRRILYAMHELSNSWNRPYKKSARVVGDAIGKYHPHGETALYDALVRMAQDFSMRYPLVDGQGNFGSVDGDSPAAMRYTEVRMARIAHLLLEDLEQDTVDMQPNYDGNEVMPDVLPGLLPNLLVNGSSGIAVGMATNIPPHNLTEICNACLALIDNPQLRIDELVQYVTGPDFPTSGSIIGRKGIQQAYHTGRGQIYIRASAEIVVKSGRESIVVSEIPFQVNKSRMIERIAELVRDKKLQGISEIRDESDKDGFRVVIDIRRNESAEIILNNLWANSQLEISFGINMVALDQGRPRLLNLKQLLVGYLGHRRTVVIRRTRFQLAKARLRGHVLEGLAIALANIDRIIRTIRESRDQKEATVRLLEIDWQVNEVAGMLERAGATACRPDGMIENYGVERPEDMDPHAPHPIRPDSIYKLSSRQAKAILDLRLHRLTGLEQEDLLREYADILDLIGRLEGILRNPEKLRNVIRDEIIQMRDQFGDERRTMILDSERNLNNEDLIKSEDRIMTLSRVGYVKAQPVSDYRTQHRGGVGKAAASLKEDDVIDHMLVANTHSPILFFTNLGKVYRLKLYELPCVDRNARGRPIVNILPLQEGEKIASVLALDMAVADSHVFMATASGVVKKTPMTDFELIRKTGKVALFVADGDELIGTALSGAGGTILLATNSGQLIHFNEQEVRSMGRTARGVRGMRLKEDERVIALIVPGEGDQLAFVSEKGYGKLVRLKHFREQGRGGRGTIGMKLTQATGSIVAVRKLSGDEDLALITDKGVLVRIPAAEIRNLGRMARGVRLARQDRKAMAIVDAVIIDPETKRPPGLAASPESS
ncbi:MAG: DNA gyrase subunit A [Gammaproteobacteria bacterium]